jgi:uncharacterized protein (TIGR02444 family)
MSLWDWTLAVYGRPGVPEACLTLQDAHGQNTSFLLWAVWAEAGDPALLERAAAVARAWEGAVLAPLRTVRRTLKAPAPPVDDVKAAELRAERVLMETLEAMSPDARGGTPALQALKAASAAWGRPAPDQALAALAVAFD